MVNANKDIVNVLHVVSKLAVGGVEKIVYEEITGYDKKRFKGSVCSIMEGGEIAEALIRDGVKVDILHKMAGHGFDWGAVKALYRLIKKNNIHVLRTHQYHPNLYGRIAGFPAGVPAIIPTFHTPYVSPDRPKRHRCIINYMLSHVSDALVPVSESVAADLIKYDRVNRRKIRIIPNGIQSENFNINTPKHQARNKYNMPGDRTIIGCVGRLTEEKGHRHLIEAAQGVNDVCIAFAGAGPLLGELQTMAKNSGVNCIFTGELNSGQVPEFLKSLDIYCSPSLWEGFGIALIEAMAAGLPVIASDLPSHKAIVGDAGVLFAHGSTEDLRSAIRRLIDDPGLRHLPARKARDRAALFSLENTIKSYERLFRELLERKQSHATI